MVFIHQDVGKEKKVEKEEDLNQRHRNAGEHQSVNDRYSVVVEPNDWRFEEVKYCISV